MTSRLTALLCCVFLLTNFDISAQNNWRNSRQITASGNLETENRNLDGFSEIGVCCSIDVDVHQSNSFRVEVEASDNILPLLLTEVRGNTLHIGYEDNVSIRNNANVRVTVHLPRLEKVSASSSSELTGHSTFTGNELQLQCSSSGKINLEFEGQRIKANVSSSGRIQLNGEAESIRVQASSSGRILAADCPVKQAEAKASSSGRIELNVSDSLEANAQSSGDIYYRGQPGITNSESSSSGKIRRMN